MVTNLTIMECACAEFTEDYFRWEYDCTTITEEVTPDNFVTTETCLPTQGECVDIPVCTAGTKWHHYPDQCIYQEPCMEGRETWDEE